MLPEDVDRAESKIFLVNAHKQKFHKSKTFLSTNLYVLFTT